MGIGAHQDGGLVTILNPEENKQGLEIEVDGQWLPVTPRPGTLVVNLGVAMHKYGGGCDCLLFCIMCVCFVRTNNNPLSHQRLTNGLFNAIRHRVVNIGEERQSFASFLHCDFDAVLQPLPALVEAGTQPISAPELGAEHYVGFFRAAIPADKQTYGHLLAWQATLQQVGRWCGYMGVGYLVPTVAYVNASSTTGSCNCSCTQPAVCGFCHATGTSLF